MPQVSRKYSRMNRLDEEMLRENFNWNPKPTAAELEAIAGRLKMDKMRVGRWFSQRRSLQNRTIVGSGRTMEVEPPKRWVKLWVKEAIVRLQTGNISLEPEVRYVHDEDSSKSEWYLDRFEEIPIDALHFTNVSPQEVFDRSAESNNVDPSSKPQFKQRPHQSDFQPLVIQDAKPDFNELEQLLQNSPKIMDCFKNNNALFLP